MSARTFSIKRILSLLFSAVICCAGFTLPTFAADNPTGAVTVVSRTDGGGIKLGEISYYDEEITVTGSYEKGWNENIAWLIYDKGNENQIYGMDEVYSKPDGTFLICFRLTDNGYGKNLILDIKAESEAEKATAELIFVNTQQKMDALLVETERLLAQCENAGFSVGYERVKYSTAKKFKDMISVYRENGETEAVNFNTNEIIRLCEEACAALQSYLNGGTEPLKTVRAATNTPTLRDGKFYSDVTVNGKAGGSQPTFYLGYGHWGTFPEMEDFRDMGINTVQYEIGPAQILKKAAPVTEWDLDDTKYGDNLKYSIEHSGENNGSVVINSAGSGEIYLSQTVSVMPNTSYTFQIDFKCESASSVWIRAIGEKEEKTWIHDGNFDSARPTWITRNVLVKTGSDQHEMTVTIGSHNNARNLMFDNAVLKLSDGAQTNLLKNADFSEKNTDIFAVNTENLQTVKDVFKRAEKYGINIIFLTAMHYFPKFMYDDYPDIANGKTADTLNPEFAGYMPFNPTHPKVQETLGAFLDVLIPEIENYKSLHSICISNEPGFCANVTSEYYLTQYREMLEDKYGSVAELNAAYNTAYSSFDEVNMPKNTYRGAAERRQIAYFNDYRLFNEAIMTEYHKAIADKIREINPNILLHTKQMEYLQSIGISNNRIEIGINNEELSKFLDLNGCDAWAYLGEPKDTVMGKTMWYDYMKSVKDVPVVNSEDHIIRDGKNLLHSDEEFKFNMTDLWQGAIHGRGASVVWIWETADTRTLKDGAFYNPNLSRRADYAAEIGKMTLDLNRLANEIGAIWDEKARVGILYSDSSITQNPYSLQASYHAYQQAMFHGEKAFFVNETTPEALNENKEIKLLIVPCCNYLKSATMEQIKLFLDGGGKVLFLNASDKAYYDENGNALNQTLLSSVMSRSSAAAFSYAEDMYVQDSKKEVESALKAALSQLNHTVEASAENGSVEWLGAEYGGDYVVNICNYGSSDTTVTLSTTAGYDMGNAVDMISGQKVGNSFTLTPNEPILLKAEGSDKIRFYVGKGDARYETTLPNKAEMSSSAVCSTAQPGDRYMHIVGVFENDRLKQTFVKNGTASDSGISSDLNFRIDDGVDLKNCEIKGFLFKADSLSPYLPAKALSY